MAGFKAEEAVEKLEWSFRPHLDAAGVTPEPSTEQVGTFFDQVRQAFDRPEGESDSKTVNVLQELSESAWQAADDKLIGAYAALCSDSPSAEQIAALPHRARLMFFGHMTRQVTDPT